MAIFGFTGTSQGMTYAQRLTVRQLLFKQHVTVLHEGDCIGADLQAAQIAKALGATIVAHPPSDPRKRAFFAADYTRKPVTYLTRNRHIAKEGEDGLIAAPPNVKEVLRGIGAGTWSTVRYARELGRPIWIVLPDGTVREP